MTRPLNACMMTKHRSPTIASHGTAGAAALAATVVSVVSLVWVGAAAAAVPPASASVNAAPPPPRLVVAVDVEWARLQSSAYRLFTGADHIQSAGLSLGYELLRPTPRLALTVGLGWLDGDEERHVWGGAHEASLDLDTYYAFGRATFALRPWLRPYASLGAGGTRGAMTLALVDGQSIKDDRASRWSAFGRGALGLQLATSNLSISQGRRSLAFSAAIELGLQAGTAISFRPEPAAPSDAKERQDRIPVSGVEIGSLPRTFPFWRMTFAMHF